MHIDEESIFHEALSRHDPRDREVYLDQVCYGNASLKSRVCSLLLSYTTSEFLESTPAEVNAYLGVGPCGKLDGSRIGPYLVLELLGEGGMGEVYLAVRPGDNTRGQVALKVIKPGMDSRQILARFQLEQETLKRLDHPHIAKYLDAGVTDTGRLFFAMELVHGISITQYCDRERLPIQQRLMLFIDTCQAVAHAHERGIVHRDLKPANVLVSRRVGNPVVKVIDFGIAKTLEESLVERGPHTRATQIVGTHGYMSPEQARWSSDVDLRADVYSMGALLYELLTGSTPIRRETGHQIDHYELRHRIQSEEPPRPSDRLARLDPDELERACDTRATTHRQLIRQIRGDLDWITLKALALDREQRYDSVSKLANDLVAYLEHRAIVARGPNLVMRMSKWAKRHGNVAKRSMLVASVVVVAVGFASFNRTIRESRLKHSEAELAKSQLKSEQMHNALVRDVQQASMLMLSRDIATAEQLLDKYRLDKNEPYADQFAVRYLQSQIPRPLEVFYGHQHDVIDMDISADRRWVVSCDRGGDIIIWDQATAKETRRLHPSEAEVTRVRFSPDGKLLATVGQDRMVSLWNVSDWTLVGQLSKHQRTINGLAWSPDSRRIASSDRDGVICIWNVQTQTCEQPIPALTGPLRCLAWSPDGRLLATAVGDLAAHVWETDSWAKMTLIDLGGKDALAIAFSSDNRYLALGGYGLELSLFDLSSKTLVHRVATLSQIWSLAFGVGNELYVGMESGDLQIFRREPSNVNSEFLTPTWQPMRILRSGNNERCIRSILPCSDLKKILVAFESGRTLHAYSMNSVLGYQPSKMDTIPIGIVPKLNYLLCSDADGNDATLRHPYDFSIEFRIPYQIGRLCLPAYLDSQKLLAIACEENGESYANIHRLSDYELVARLKFSTQIHTLSFSRDGKFLAIAGKHGRVRIWDLVSKSFQDLSQGLGEYEARAIFSPSSDTLVLGPAGTRKLFCLHSKNLQELRTIETRSGWGCLSYHPDGESLVVGESDGFAVWKGDLSSLLWLSPLSGSLDLNKLWSFSFTPDQQTMATLNRNGDVQLWDWRTRSKLVSTPLPVNQPDRWLSFTDRHTLIVGNSGEPILYKIGVADSTSTSSTK